MTDRSGDEAPYPWQSVAWSRLCRAMDDDRLAHGLLLLGAEGLGKGALADALVSRFLGHAAGAGADEAGRYVHPDLMRVEPPEDKVTIGIDQVRQLAEHFSLTSHAGRGKAAIIEPADRMTMEAANSLLKTLEEPPPGSLIVVVTARRSDLPPTVVSRCQQVDMAAPSREAALAFLEASTSGEDWAALLEMAGNAPLKALALAELGFSDLDHKLGSDLTGIIRGETDPVSVAARWAKPDPRVCLDWLERQVAGAIRATLLDQPAAWVRPAALERLKKAGPGFTLPEAYRYLDAVRYTAARIDGPVNTQLAIEALLVAWTSGLSAVNRLDGG